MFNSLSKYFALKLMDLKLEEKIERTRNGYKDVSIRGSILFFVIKDLSIVDPMY